MARVVQRPAVACDVEGARWLPSEQATDHGLDVFFGEGLLQRHREALFDLRGLQDLLWFFERLEEVLAEDDELGFVLEGHVGLFGFLVDALEFLEGEVFALFEGAVDFAGERGVPQDACVGLLELFFEARDDVVDLLLVGDGVAVVRFGVGVLELERELAAGRTLAGRVQAVLLGLELFLAVGLSADLRVLVEALRESCEPRTASASSARSCSAARPRLL